ncbi:hypothetical protein TRVL_03312 [Trypanosoma vivax]|nr:hypothetical protein TRVL_03312 [Trypanosoma vivax]
MASSLDQLLSLHGFPAVGSAESLGDGDGNSCSPPSGIALPPKENKKSLVKKSYTERMRQTKIDAAVDPCLVGKRAAAWVQAWDRGSRDSRLRILDAFLALHSDSNINRIESDLGDASMLFFTRITAWLRLTCKLGRPLRLALASIALFIRGVRYMTCLVEVGGALTLIDALATGSLCVEDRKEVLLLLLYIANAGRVYREMMYDGDGVELLLKALHSEKEAENLDMFSCLFQVLGSAGSKTFSLPIYWGMMKLILSDTATSESRFHAVRLLNVFQTSLDKRHFDSLAASGEEDQGDIPVVGLGSEVHDEAKQLLLNSLFSLLYRPEIHLRVEGSEVLALISKNVRLAGSILTRCFDTVNEDHLVIKREDDPNELKTLRRHQITFASTAVKVMLVSPGCVPRNRLMVNIVARSSGHFTLFKCLRLLESSNTGAVVDCCRVIQFLCREATLRSRNTVLGDDEDTAVRESLDKLTKHIQEVVGSTMYGVLLYEELSEGQVESIVRSVMSWHSSA